MMALLDDPSGIYFVMLDSLCCQHPFKQNVMRGYDPLGTLL